MRRLAAVAVLAIVPAAFAAAQPMSEAAKSRVRSEVQAAVDVIVAASRAADVDGCLARMSTSPGSRFSDGETVYESLEAQRAIYKDVFARIRSQDLQLDRQEIDVLSADLAAYTGKGHFTSSYKTGETTPRRAFAWTFLWRREKGGWRIVHGHQSLGATSGAPAAASAAANPITGPRYLYIEEFEIPTGTAPSDAIAESSSWVRDLRKTGEYRDVRLLIHNTGPAFSLYIMMEPNSWQALETGANKFLAARPDILGQPLKWARHSDNLLTEVPVP
jgi:uncharacterized protein (TIGR02246 family)